MTLTLTCLTPCQLKVKLLLPTVDSNLLLETRSLNGFFLVLRRLFDSMLARVRQIKVLKKTKIWKVSTLEYLLYESHYIEYF
jgi:hypothetical protein